MKSPRVIRELVAAVTVWTGQEGDTDENRQAIADALDDYNAASDVPAVPPADVKDILTHSSGTIADMCDDIEAAAKRYEEAGK
jgi:hypothetical protein